MAIKCLIFDLNATLVDNILIPNKVGFKVKQKPNK